MRIAYLTHQYFPRHVGGTEVYTRGLVRRVRQRGHQPLVVTYHESSDTVPRLERSQHEDVSLLEIHYNLGAARNPLAFEYDHPQIAALVHKELQEFQPDVVHFTHAMKLSAACIKRCRELNVPIFVTLTDFWFLCPRHTLLKPDGTLCNGPGTDCLACVQDLHGFPDHPSIHPSDREGDLRQLEMVQAVEDRPGALRKVLSEVDRIVALSRFQQSMFAQNGFPASRMEVIPHGIETEDLTVPQAVPGKDPHRPPTIVFVASLVPHKGPHILLEALSRLPDLPVKCLMYGRLRRDAYCRSLQAQSANDARIRWMGDFPPEKLGAVLAKADLLAFPALWYENAPLTVKAAHYLGIPVLASRIGSLPEMIEPNQSGWLVEPDNAGAWADAIAHAVQNPLPPFTADVPTMDAHAERIFDLYEAELRKYSCRSNNTSTISSINSPTPQSTRRLRAT